MALNKTEVEVSFLDDSDQYLSPAEAAKRMPGRPSICSIYRWMANGCRGVKLQSIALGGKRLIPASAISEFIARSTAAAPYGTPVASTVRTNKQRARAIAQAEKELSEAGI
jgi:hypothetical protein